jgi:hypothetical protein
MMSRHSVTTLHPRGTWLSLVLLAVACSATGTSTDPPTNSHPSGGASATGGATGTTGGFTNTGGFSTNGGVGTNGGAATTGGVSTNGGVGMTGGVATNGGVATTGGAATNGGAATTGGTSGSCAPVVGSAMNQVVYDGGMMTAGSPCSNANRPPLSGYFYATADATCTASLLPMKNSQGAYPGEAPGHAGGMDCAFHASAMACADYGAAVGTSLNQAGGQDCPYDASAFTGVTVFLKGSTSGTHGLDYAAAPNTVRLKVKTNQATGNDDFGGWCPVTTAWAECKVPFASMAQEGFGTVVAGGVNKANILKIEIQASKQGESMMTPSASMDIWVDDLGFY